MKKNNIISDWLDGYGDPEIEKKVEMKLEDMNKERFNQIIDEVYSKYLTKYVGYDDVPSKKLFLFDIKNNTEFSERWGLKIEERELSTQERKRIYEMEYTNDIEVENNHWLESKLKTRNIPTKLITITYKNETIESYE